MPQFESVTDILNYAIEREQDAIAFYSGMAATTGRPSMKQTFEEFAQEETSHRDKLEAIRDKGLMVQASGTVLNLKFAEYLTDPEPSKNMTYQESLILAMKREKESYWLYTALADTAGTGEARDMFRFLAQEEANHKLRFEIEYDDIVLSED